MTDESIKPTILLIGGSGFVGRSLGEALVRLGYSIRLLSTQGDYLSLPYPCSKYKWDGRLIPTEVIEGCAAIVNLAGAGIADKPWSEEYKKQIVQSRVNSTRALADCLKAYEGKIPVVIQASAVGYYGAKSRKASCNESSDPGVDFLAKTSLAWEAEAAAIQSHSRLVVARFGMILGWDGGALPELWKLYAAGLGAQIGSGSQSMNWIHIKDVIGFVIEAIKSDSYEGAYNLVAPKQANQSDFHKLLSRYTPSLQLMTVPKLLVNTILGERSDLVVDNPEVESIRLASFTFKFESLEEAVADLVSHRSRPQLFYITYKQWLPASEAEIWQFMSVAENLQQITPPWLNFSIHSKSTPEIIDGCNIEYRLRFRGLPMKWRSLISEWHPQKEFVDEQLSGPYHTWVHRHRFSALGNGTLIEDFVDYQLPLFPFSLLALPIVQSDLNRIFEYRTKTLTKLFSHK